MILTIDNLDGLGPIDYSPMLDVAAPLKIERTLNEPTRCSGVLFLTGQAVPVRRGRVVITADQGTMLFTGYIASEAVEEYAGAGTTGVAYRTVFSAVSDEWLLNKQAVPFLGNGLAQAGGAVLAALTNRVDPSLLTTAAVTGGRPVGIFEPSHGQNWSSNAGTIASTTYSSYRAVNGALTLTPAGSVTHTFSDGDGTLQIGSLKSAAIKELANDVTVSGAMEPAAYVTEVFTGDGTTVLFQLTDSPFIPRHSTNNKYLLNDSFNTGSFNPQVWTVDNPGVHLGFGANGLQLSGGNGFDGQTTLAAIDPIEIGGTLVIEAGSLQLAAASDGVICGLYEGSILRSNCFAGWNVRQSAGTTIVVPFINGAEVGSSYTVLMGHNYTLRLRLHCAEVQRLMQTFYARVDGAVEAFGGGAVGAPLEAVFELVDLGVSSNTPATILFDTATSGPITSTPASCTFAAVDAVQLFGSMGYCRVEQTGSAWIVSTLPSGATYTRLMGGAGEGVDCKVTSTGRVTFFIGRAPLVGELVSVRYRSRQRSVARIQDPTSVALEKSGNAPGTAAWLGKVLKPIARSTVDCESAAAAILSFASSRSAAVAGTYVALNPQLTADIWPGDVLAMVSGADSGTPATNSVVVRRVTITNSSASPELLTYHVGFANDWAEELGLTLSGSVAVDTLLPQVALDGPAAVLPNLDRLTVVSVSASVIQIDTGTAPPTGGGFEVRRRDGDFGPMVDQDLVLRVPVRGISIPREAQVERYFIRMYDGSTPPVYSRFSSAVFTDVPVA